MRTILATALAAALLAPAIALAASQSFYDKKAAEAAGTG